ncbi:hypothetical protein [Micromonospora tulbaghiae]
MTVGTAPVRYQLNADNTVLRDVLHRLWDYRCYACGTPKDFTDVQIDHLIARNLTPANRTTVLHGYDCPPSSTSTGRRTSPRSAATATVRRATITPRRSR